MCCGHMGRYVPGLIPATLENRIYASGYELDVAFSPACYLVGGMTIPWLFFGQGLLMLLFPPFSAFIVSLFFKVPPCI